MVRSVECTRRDLTTAECGSQDSDGTSTEDQPVIVSTEPPEPTVSALLDVRAVALLLACSTRHVYRLHDAGRMPAALKVGSLVRWSRQAIASWVADGCKPTRQAGRAKP